MSSRSIAVVIVHRHGARLPNVILPGDLMFPSNPKFWNKYNASLIPIGVKQTRKLGKSMRERYIEELTSIKPHKISEHISSISSNTERSIMSCVSFVDGFLPKTPKHVSFEKDYSSESYHKSESYLREKGLTLGLKIHVECGIECMKDLENCEIPATSLFHRHKSNEVHEKWKKYNMTMSPEFQAMISNLLYQKLMDKLYEMTEYPDISPDKDMLTRLMNARVFITHLRISHCQHSEPLPNIKDIHLTDDDKKMIEYIAQVNYEHLFQPYNKLTSQEVGSLCVDELLREILHFFEESLTPNSTWRFREYSAHDTTLLAIAARMGVTINSPNFAGYFLYELYPSGHLAIYYNSDPDIIDIKNLKPKSLKRYPMYEHWDKYSDGLVDWTTCRELFLPPIRPM